MGDVFLSTHFGVVPRPTLAVGVIEADPQQVVFRSIVDDEVSESGALGRVERDWRIELQDHRHSPQCELIFEKPNAFANVFWVGETFANRASLIRVAPRS